MARNPAATPRDLTQPRRGFGGPQRREALGLLDPTLARGRQRAKGPLSDLPLLDKASLLTAPIPFVGDVVGAAADTRALVQDPSLLNAGLLAAGMVPGIPAGSVIRSTKEAIGKGSGKVRLFHGTPIKGIKEFDLSKVGSIQKSDFGEGVYLTPDPDTADYYRREALAETDESANEAFKRFDELEKQGTFVNGAPQFPEGTREALDEFRRARAAARNKNAGEVVEVEADIKNPLVLGGQTRPDPDIAKQAKERGFDSIIVRDGLGEEVLVFDPSKLKIKR